MKIFITGYTGFIGSHFLKKALSVLGPGDTIYALSRTASSYLDSRVITIAAGLETPEKYESELLGSDYVFHIGALAIYGNKLPYDTMNYEPVRKIIDILSHSQKIKNFVFLSSIGAVDRAKNDACDGPLSVESTASPMSGYGRSKLKAEQAIRASQVPFTIIRPTWVYGPGMRTNSHIFSLAGLAKKKSPMVHFGFPGKVSLIHVDDLCEAMIRCLDNPNVIGKTYFGLTETRSIGDLLADLYEVQHGKRPKQIRIPRFQAVMGKVHPVLPLTASNLFLDYLYAKDDNFKKDFGLWRTQAFVNGRLDVTRDITTAYWVVTGAGSGIGLALTKKLLSEKESVIAIDKDIAALENLQNPYLIAFKADLSRKEEVEKAASKTRGYRLKVWINNAGIGQRGTVAEVTDPRIEEIFLTNVIAPMKLVKTLLPQFKKDGTTIVNMSSSIAWNPLPYMSIYSSSKAALANWSESLAYELKETNKVLTLYPSGTKTNFQKNSGVKVLNEGKDLLDPDKVAERIIQSARSGKELPILGFKMSLLVTASKFLPSGLKRKIWGDLFSSLR